MNVIIVGFMTLMPALVAVILVAGIPVLLAAMVLPRLRTYLLAKLGAADRLVRAQAP